MISDQSLYPIVKEASGSVATAVGSTLADVWQAIIGDRVTAWRLKNAASLNERLKAELGKSGQRLSLEKVPERIAFSWFEQATQSDEPEIQDLFAKLLSNAADGNSDALRKRNIELIGSLAPDEALLLKAIFEWWNERQRSHISHRSDFEIDMRSHNFTSRMSLLRGDVMHSLEALCSLGIMRFDRDIGFDGLRAPEVIAALSNGRRQSQWTALDDLLEYHEKYVLTSVGKSLIKSLFKFDASPSATKHQ